MSAATAEIHNMLRLGSPHPLPPIAIGQVFKKHDLHLDVRARLKLALTIVVVVVVCVVVDIN